MSSSSWDETSQLKAEEIVLRSTLAQRPSRPPPLPASPPPPTTILIPIKTSQSSSDEQDEGHPSTSSSSETDDEIEKIEPLKFERKSSSPCMEIKKDYFQSMPWHVMQKIFSRLEIHERAKAAEVCRRWYNILTDGKCPLENVVVLNVFQKSVWKNHVSKNAGSTVRCFQLPNHEALIGILSHISSPSSVKIWYNHPEFAKTILQNLKDVNVKAKCVDIFPYSSRVELQYFYEYLPKLTGITMRPHGTDHFWDGLDLNYFPAFENLDTLILDSFNLKDQAELPENLTTFEWHNRHEPSFPEMLTKLSKLKKLEYLHIGHADLINHWQKFLNVISFDNMPNLSYLMFRFCRFGKEATNDSNQFLLPLETTTLKKVQFLKLDLCYGYLPRIIDNFMQMTSESLKILSLNIISDETPILFDQIYGSLSMALKSRKISLHLGLLQKSTRRYTEESQESRYRSPSFDFLNTLWKFESSFCDDKNLLNSIFLNNMYPYVTELKFISCPAMNNEILESVSILCPRLKKLSLLNCDGCDNNGIIKFVINFKERLSKNLEIVWKRDTRRFARPAAFYLHLTSNFKDHLDGLQTRFYCKSLNESNSEESIVIREKGTGKTLVIQDYDRYDNQRIFGIVLPYDPDEQEDPPPDYEPPLPPDLSELSVQDEQTNQEQEQNP